VIELVQEPPQPTDRTKSFIDKGFAVAARRVADLRHQFRWDAHDGLTGSEQVAFQSPRQMPAVLDRPEQLVAQAENNT
jgi:hypothetical protein